MISGGVTTLLFAAVLPLPGPFAKDPGVRPVWWSPSLQVNSVLDARQQIGAPLGDEFPVLVNGIRRTVRTCRDFLEVVDKKFDTETENDWNVLWAQGVRCVALGLLAAGKPATESHLAGLNWEKITIADLPPELGFAISPDEEAAVRRAAENCRSLRNVDATARISRRKGDTLSVRADSWTGSITLYARGDFNGDGTEDLLVEREAGVRRGTAVLSSLFVITKKADGDCLRVIRRIP